MKYFIETDNIVIRTFNLDVYGISCYYTAQPSVTVDDMRVVLSILIVDSKTVLLVQS